MNMLAQSPLLANLGWSLIHFLWQGALVGLIYFYLRHLLRQAAPQWRYILALSALLVLALLPALTLFYLDGWHSQNIPSISSPTAYSVAAAPLAVPTSFLIALDHGTPAYLSWVVLVWLAGVACMMMRAFHGWRQAGMLRLAAMAACIHPWQPLLDALQDRMHIRRAVRLLESVRVHAPLVIGWLKPAILIPPSTVCGLSWQQAEMILAHELAHIRRHDYLFNLLQVVVETLLFYHPVVHWISRDARNEREFCCDDAAMKICGDRVAYLKALAELEEQRLHTSPALAANGGVLWNRAYRLVYRIEPVGRHSAWSITLVLLASALAMLLIIYPRNSLTQHATVSLAHSKPAMSETLNPATRPPQLAVTHPMRSIVPTPTRIEIMGPKFLTVHALVIRTFAEPAALLATPPAPQLAAVPATTVSATAAITVVAPRPLPQPEYPYQALRDGLGGSVQVSFRVSRSGRATDVLIKMLSGPAIFASAVRAALENWQFNPVQVNGKILTPQISLAFVFNPDPASKPAGTCLTVTGSHMCLWYQVTLKNLPPQRFNTAGTEAAQPDEDIPVKLAVVETKQSRICQPQDNCFFKASQPPLDNERHIQDQLRMLSQGFIGGGSF